MLPPHKTKIVCTIGPASQSREILTQMMAAGMNVARLNFSHGKPSEHRTIVENIRTAAREAGRRVAIMGDLPGPKMRIGSIAREPIWLQPGDRLVLTTEEVSGEDHRVKVSFSGLPRSVKKGDTLFLNDGFIHLKVTAVSGSDVECRVTTGGELRSRKGLNLPGIDLGIGAFTENDRQWLAFSNELALDAVSQSFVETSADIAAVREAAETMDYHPFVIAKIERATALDHIDEILEAADGIMAARGDLGVEVPIERIAAVQKMLIRKANIRAKPVITATQMLESMTDRRRPTRAESTDVSNAILDGTDCVMLSGESAVGRYPVEAVRMLAKIASVIEPLHHHDHLEAALEEEDASRETSLRDLIAWSVEATMRHISASAVVTPTRSGATARSIARFRLPVWVAAVSTHESTCQNLQFSHGVCPLCIAERPDDWKAFVRDWLQAEQIQQGIVVLTEGPSAKHPNANHRMELIDLRPNNP